MSIAYGLVAMCVFDHLIMNEVLKHAYLGIA